MEHEVKAAREVLGAFGELPDQEAMDQNAEPDRYVSIEQIESHEAFQFMEDFIGELNDKRAREGLSRALAGPKPFRRFRDTLNSYPMARERWFEYEAKRRREYIEQWALEVGSSWTSPPALHSAGLSRNPGECSGYAPVGEEPPSDTRPIDEQSHTIQRPSQHKARSAGYST